MYSTDDRGLRDRPRAPRADAPFRFRGVAGATATATLDERFMASRVVVTYGGTTTEFTYGNYDDWNNPLNLIEAYYAGRITERRGGRAGVFAPADPAGHRQTAQRGTSPRCAPPAPADASAPRHALPP
jgi:hypothetical protein